MPPILELRNVRSTFPIRSGVLRRQTGSIAAVADVSFSLEQGKALGIVGESGCGKTTLARTIAGLQRAESGEILFRGRDLSKLSDRQWREVRREIQMVFQDPYNSLNPRRTVRQIIEAAWKIHPDILPKNGWAAEVERLLGLVGLDPAHADRYPHQFSGGQRQRIGIARALALRPSLLVCDEPVSALDVSIQAQVINLLKDLQDQLGLSVVLIAHDLSVVRHLCDTVAVMYLGRFVELGRESDVYEQPSHPYTKALLTSVPTHEPRSGPDTEIVLEGDVPSPANPPSGCPFRTRCWKAADICAEVMPPLEAHDGRGAVACHFPEPVEVAR